MNDNVTIIILIIVLRVHIQKCLVTWEYAKLQVIVC